MKGSVFSFLGCLGLLFSSISIISAQTSYHLSPEQTEFSVDGTSSLHNWTMKLESGKSKGTASVELNGQQLEGIEHIKIEVETTGLKSGKDAMDENAYNALKTEEFPFITFEIDKINKLEAADDGYQVAASGNLTIAGSTQPVELEAICSVNAEQVTCSGSKGINMTEYEVDPPTAMFGSLKTGEEITINFKAVFVQ